MIIFIYVNVDLVKKFDVANLSKYAIVMLEEFRGGALGLRCFPIHQSVCVMQYKRDPLSFP
jgi:hypothetical protein